MTKPATKWRANDGTGMTAIITPLTRISQAGLTRISQAGLTRITNEGEYIPKAHTEWTE